MIPYSHITPGVGSLGCPLVLVSGGTSGLPYLLFVTWFRKVKDEIRFAISRMANRVTSKQIIEEGVGIGGSKPDPSIPYQPEITRSHPGVVVCGGV